MTNEKQTLNNQIQALNNNNEELQSALKLSCEENTRVKARLEMEQSKLIQTNQNVGQKDTELTTLKGEYSVLMEQNKEWENKYKQLSAHVSTLEQTIQGLQSDKHNLTESLDSYGMEITSLKKTDEERVMLIKTRDTELSASKTEMSELQSMIATLQGTVEQQETALHLLDAQLQSEKNEKQEANMQLQSKISQYNDAKEQIQQIQDDLQRAELSADKEKQEMDARIKSLKKESEDLRSLIDAQKKERERIEKGNAELKQQMMSLKKQSQADNNELTKKANDLQMEIEKLRFELSTEHNARKKIEIQVQTMEEEKIRAKKHKDTEMAYDIERMISAFPGDLQEKAERFIVYTLFETTVDYCNSIPARAYLLFNLIHYKIHSVDFERLETLIVNSMEAAIRSCTPDQLGYWLANVAAVLQLFSSKDHWLAIQQVEKSDISYERMLMEVSQFLSTERYITFDSDIGGLSAYQKSAPTLKFLLFAQQVSRMFIRTYCLLLTNLFNQIQPMLKSTLEHQQQSASSTPQTPRRQETVQQKNVYTVQDIVAIFTQLDKYLKKFRISREISAHCAASLLSFIDNGMFNELLMRKEMCKASQATVIRHNADILEQAATQLAQGKPLKLNIARQIAAMFVMDKNLLVNERNRREIVPDLNDSQLNKLISMYSCEEFETPIQNSTFHFFSRLAQEQQKISKSDTLLLNARAISPIQDVQDLFSEAIELDLQFTSLPQVVKDELDKKLHEREVRETREAVAKAEATLASSGQKKTVASSSFRR